MFKEYIAKLLTKYQWFFNPFIDRRHPVSLLMANRDFKPEHQKLRKIFNVFYEGGRLIGIFYSEFPDELFKTRVRVCVYEKRDITDSDFGKIKYSMVYIFMHQLVDGNWKLGSQFKTPFMEFKDLATYLKTAKQLSTSRALVFKFQQMSKVIPVTDSSKTS